MLYRPASGNMWDTSIVYHDGHYFLFSMYEGEGETDNTRANGDPANNVWCAVSDDGVHWRDLGPVIEDQPFRVWKMFVRRLGDRFILNHGSFSMQPGHGNDTLYFWESDDLLNWRLLSDSTSHPDPRWYRPEGRWDHMYMLPDDATGGFVGYCVATPHARYPYPSCGLQQSNDGIHWQVLPPPVVEWGDMPAPHMWEVGGCEKENGKYYLIGGTDRYGDGQGYGVFTLVSDYWNGPFRPDMPAYRLCGSSGYSGVVGVQWLASFGRGKDNELLITNYLTDGVRNYSRTWGRFGWVWFLPIKKAISDADGHLRMGYWPQNERLKAAALPAGGARLLFPAVVEQGTQPLRQDAGSLMLDTRQLGEKAESGLESRFIDEYALAVLEQSVDLQTGLVVEGTLTVEAYDKSRPARAGFYFEETPDTGTVLLLEAGDPRWRKTEIGVLRRGASLEMAARDVTGYGCATVTGITNRRQHTFRLFYRRNMFELYIDDLLVQTFITAGTPDGRVGFIAQNATCVFGNLQMWTMAL